MDTASPRPVIPHRMPEFDAVRGIAALMVVWAHTWQGSGHLVPGLGWYASLRWGTLALDLFFALSGFLITGILLDQREHPRYYPLFYARRALKIFPLLLLVLNLRPLIFLGTISYGIYLYHAMVLCILTQGFHKTHPEIPFLVQYAAVLFLSTAIAWISWTWFEEPILRLKRYFSYATPLGASTVPHTARTAGTAEPTVPRAS